MIFSHMQKPIDMRKTRVGKRIYVHRVPLGTALFCPYCCATVDTAFVTLIFSSLGGPRQESVCRAHPIDSTTNPKIRGLGLLGPALYSLATVAREAIELWLQLMAS